MLLFVRCFGTYWILLLCITTTLLLWKECNRISQDLTCLLSGGIVSNIFPFTSLRIPFEKSLVQQRVNKTVSDEKKNRGCPRTTMRAIARVIFLTWMVA